MLRRLERDDEWVLYNDLSGETHLLGGNAVHVLLALQQSPLAERDIVDSLSAAFEFDPGSDVAADVAALLANLSACALIEC